MPAKCCVLSCGNQASKVQGITLHKFPKNETQKRLWISVIPVRHKMKDPKVCNEHFLPEDYERHLRARTLKYEAVPSVFPVDCSESKVGMDDEDTNDLIPLASFSQTSLQIKEELKACRICLAIHVKMYHLDLYQLKYPSEEIINSLVQPKDNLPQYICYECTARLKNYHCFKEKCLKASKLLHDVIESGQTLTYELLNNIKTEHIPPNLTTSQPRQEIYIVYNETEEVDTKTHIKSEDENSNYEDPLDFSFNNIEIKQESKESIKIKPNTRKSNQKRTKVKKKRLQINTKLERKNCKVEKQTQSKIFSSTYVVPRLDESLWECVQLNEEEQRKRLSKKKESPNYKKSVFKCDSCCRGFGDEVLYNLHEQRHDPSFGEYECDICKLRFKEKGRHVKHVSYHAMLFRCRRCPFVTVDEGALTKHDKYHEGVTYECKQCNWTFKGKSTYQGHLRIYHRSEFICSVCGLNFLSALAVKRHSTLMHGEVTSESSDVSLFCDKCEIQFLTTEGFSMHKTTSNKHNEEGNVKKSTRFYQRAYKQKRSSRLGITRVPTSCRECGETFESEQAYKRHHKASHPGVKYSTRHMCDVCGSTFSSNVSMMIHRRTHTGEKPFECTQCARRFNDKGNWKRHLAIHLPEKPFQCEACEKRFTSKHEAKNHYERIHLKVRWDKRDRRRRTKDSGQVSVPGHQGQFLNAFLTYNNV